MSARRGQHVRWSELHARAAAEDPDFERGVAQERVNLELAQLAYDLRQRAGLTQRELAERMGTTQPAIARLEGGGTSPTIELLGRLARALGANLTLEMGMRGEAPVQVQVTRHSAA